MIVYHVGHLGAFPLCITHKLFFHHDEETVFIIDKLFLPKIVVSFFEENHQKFSWLGNLILYNERSLIDVSEQEQLEGSIPVFFDELLQNHNIDILNVSIFYNTFDTINAFGVYLRQKKLPFAILEMIPDQLKKHRYSENNNYPSYAKVIEKYQALNSVGDTLVKSIRRSYSETKLQPKDNVEIINYEDLLSYLTLNDKINIINSYFTEECFSDIGKSILMTMSSGWIINKLNPPVKESFFLLYQLYADYFMLNSSAKLIIKPHPNTDFHLDFWKKQFPEALILPGYFPSNFIKLIPDINIEKIIGTGTSGANISLNNSPEIINSGNYYTFYYILHRFYVAIELIKTLSLKNLSFFHFGMHNNFTWMFEEVWGICKSEWNNFRSVTKNSVFIIDDIFWNDPKDKRFLDEAIKKSEDSNIFIFLNSKNDYCFYNSNNNEIIDYIIPITIEKTAIREGINSYLYPETIYVFCKSQEIRQKILDFSLNQNLANTGIEIFVKPKSLE